MLLYQLQKIQRITSTSTATVAMLSNDFNWLAVAKSKCLSDNRIQMFVHAVFEYGILKDGILKVGKLVAKT